MGAGIAQVCATSGYSTLLFDINKEMLNKALHMIGTNLDIAIEKGKLRLEEKDAIISRIRAVDNQAEVRADLILEAIVEKLEIKRKLFNELANNNSSSTILATNTSSIPITQIASGIPHPQRVIGIHFFNPAHLMKLVEVIAGVETGQAEMALVRNFVSSLGKTAVVANDAPGFIVNRVARHYYVEALKLLEENVSSFEGIDALMESSGFKMGPFRLMDLIGVDTNFSVTSSIFEQFHYDGKFRPSRIQKQKVDAGHWGKKTGRGFYDYSKPIQ